MRYLSLGIFLILSCAYSSSAFAESLSETLFFLIFNDDLKIASKKLFSEDYSAHVEEGKGNECLTTDLLLSIKDSCHFDATATTEGFKSSCASKRDYSFRWIYTMNYDMSHVNDVDTSLSGYIYIKSTASYALETRKKDGPEAETDQDITLKPITPSGDNLYLWYVPFQYNHKQSNFQRKVAAINYYRSNFCSGSHF